MNQLSDDSINIIVSYYITIGDTYRENIYQCRKLIIGKHKFSKILFNYIRKYFIQQLIKKYPTYDTNRIISVIIQKKTVIRYPFISSFENGIRYIEYNDNKPKGKLLIYFLCLFYNYKCNRTIHYTYTTTLKNASAGKLHGLLCDNGVYTKNKLMRMKCWNYKYFDKVGKNLYRFNNLAHNGSPTDPSLYKRNVFKDCVTLECIYNKPDDPIILNNI